MKKLPVCLLLMFSFLGKLTSQTSDDAEIFVQLGHSAPVNSIAFSPSGRYVVSGSSDKSLKLWDFLTGKEIRTLTGHSSGVNCVAFLPNGEFVISGSDDHTIKLWDYSTGKVLRTYSGHSASVTAAAISQDGKYLISGSLDKIIKVWNISTGREILSLTGHTDGISSVALSPDVTSLISGSYDRTLRMWNVATGKEMRTFEKCPSEVSCTAFSPDGRFIISGSLSELDPTLRLWDASSGRLVRTFSGHSDAVGSVAFSPNGQFVISGSFDRSVKVWDILSGKNIQTFVGHSNVVSSVSFSPNSKLVLSGSLDRTIRMWDMISGKEIRRFAGSSVAISSVAISSDGKSVSSGSRDKSLKLWDISSGKETRRIEVNSSVVSSVALSANERLIVSGSPNGMVSLWDLSTGKEIWTLMMSSGWLGCVACSPDGKFVLSGSSDDEFSADGQLTLRDGTTGKEIWTAAHQSVNTARFSPDGKFVISGMSDGTLKLWDITNIQKERIFTGHTGGILTVAYSPDGRFVLSGGYDNTLRLWDVSSGKTIQTFGGHQSYVYTAAISPDGQFLISGSGDKTLKLWDVSTGKEKRTFIGHSGDVNSVAFLPGNFVISGSRDGTIRIWDVSNGNEIASMISFSDSEWLCMTPDKYFNCSPNGAKNINVRIGNSVYSIDNFFETYYRPDIVKARLSGADLSDLKVTADITKGVKLPPTVTMKALRTSGQFVELSYSEEKDLAIISGTIKVKIAATNTGGGIKGLRLFNNGKAVGENIRAFKAVQSENMFEQEFTVALTEGENKFSAVGFSEDMSESNPVTSFVTYKPVAWTKPNMYVLGVGINEYRNSKYNLNYCVGDVTGFVEVILPKAKKLFTNVYTTTITNREATRSNVMKALADIQSKAKPEDVLIIFYAGHGIALDAEVEGAMKNEFFYVLSDVTQMTDPLKCTQDGISGTEMRKALSGIKAGKQVMFVDACNSGAFAQQFAVRGAAEENALAKLSRATGSVIYASTTKEQFATEFKDLQHGAFTYVLIDALSGKASLANGQITVSSIKAFVDDQIPVITKKYKGEEQFPTTFIWGQDFPIGVK